MSQVHPDLKSDPNIREMVEDLQESRDFGDPLSTWFEADGTPQAWFVEAAYDEYTRRNGPTDVPKNAIAETLYALLTADA